MPALHTFKIGDIVTFGRRNGEKTLGKIVKTHTRGAVGRPLKNLKVETLEARGTSAKNQIVGRVWGVHPSLLELATRPAPAPVVEVTLPQAQYIRDAANSIVHGLTLRGRPLSRGNVLSHSKHRLVTDLPPKGVTVNDIVDFTMRLAAMTITVGS